MSLLPPGSYASSPSSVTQPKPTTLPSIISVNLSHVPLSNRTSASDKAQIGVDGTLVSVGTGTVVSSGNLKKGECFIVLSLEDSGGNAYTRLARGYTYTGTDLAWQGNLKINATDILKIFSWNSQANLTKITVRMRLVV